jgi:hypothetical protein
MEISFGRPWQYEIAIAGAILGLYAIAYLIGIVVGLIRVKMLVPKGENIINVLSKANKMIESGAGYRELIGFFEKNRIPEDLANMLIRNSKAVSEIVEMLDSGSDLEHLVSNLEYQRVSNRMDEAITKEIIQYLVRIRKKAVQSGSGK